ncbi:MAG: hypothetical protein P8J61_04470 [Gammaproteobacteria bacterium]|nr:hypothetical protein [Gammaproteobacteria bacterium]
MNMLLKKVIIMLLAVSIAVFPSIRASAQGGAGSGTIAGVSTSAIAVGLGILVGAFVIVEATNNGDVTFVPSVATTTTTTTTTTTQGSGSTTTTTTN